MVRVVRLVATREEKQEKSQCASGRQGVALQKQRVVRPSL